MRVFSLFLKNADLFGSVVDCAVKGETWKWRSQHDLINL